MSGTKKLLVLGANGAVGETLLSSFEGTGRFEVHGAARSPRRESDLPFDALDRQTWENLPQDASAAFFCFGTTSIEECESRPEETRRVNVEATLDLARHLGTRGTHIVYFSSNLVFRGEEPYCRPGARRLPRSEYARQKVQVEDALLMVPGKVTIFRVTKYAKSLSPLIRNWAASLRAGEPIEPYRDRLVCPFDRLLLCTAAAQAIERKATGIYHLSGENDINYLDLATWVAGAAGAPADLVRAIDAPWPDPAATPDPSAPWPMYTSLDMTSTTERLGVGATPLGRIRDYVESVARDF